MTNCPACSAGRVHTPEEWSNHPNAGVGFSRDHGVPMAQEENGE